MSINFLKLLSKEESKQMDKKMVEWVKKTLNKSDCQWELYNILSRLRVLIEKAEREKK